MSRSVLFAVYFESHFSHSTSVNVLANFSTTACGRCYLSSSEDSSKLEVLTEDDLSGDELCDLVEQFLSRRECALHSDRLLAAGKVQ